MAAHTSRIMSRQFASASLVLALSLSACGEADPREPTVCLTRRCHPTPLAFEPSHPAVEQAIADLRRATGADVIADPYGIPVLFDGDVGTMPTGERHCASTRRAYLDGEILITEIHVDDLSARPDCGTTWQVVAHEMIHALAPAAKHTAAGLFADRINGASYFDAASVAALCAHIACARSAAR
jgi:hypothetical protein